MDGLEVRATHYFFCTFIYLQLLQTRLSVALEVTKAVIAYVILQPNKTGVFVSLAHNLVTDLGTPQKYRKKKKQSIPFKH